MTSTTTSTSPRLARLAGGLVAAVVVLTGCSGDADGPTASSPTGETSAGPAAGPNEADLAFARGMIPHHEGALTMAEAAQERASDPRVADLAERIGAGQDPEIDLMTGWLEEWGQPLEEESGHMSGMDHGPGGMGGGAMDMQDVPPAGPDFDRMWLEAMIEHHEGAVEMAQTEVEEGRDAEAVDLARLIGETQTREIEEMRQLLTELGG